MPSGSGSSAPRYPRTHKDASGARTAWPHNGPCAAAFFWGNRERNVLSRSPFLAATWHGRHAVDRVSRTWEPGGMACESGMERKNESTISQPTTRSRWGPIRVGPQSHQKLPTPIGTGVGRMSRLDAGARSETVSTSLERNGIRIVKDSVNKFPDIQIAFQLRTSSGFLLAASCFLRLTGLRAN